MCNPVNWDAAYDSIGYSVAAYEGSSEVNAFTSKYDYSLVNQARLTKQERLGFALFQGKGKCKACHVSSGAQPLFTDFTYDNLGLPKNPENPVYTYNPGFVDLGLGGFLASRQDYAPFAQENLGKHKVPTLRNVDLRPTAGFVKPYGHNSYFKSLYGIVHFYNTRDVLPVCPGDYTEAQALAAQCWPAPEVADNLNTTEQAIVAFLKTLSDGYMP
jgi:cytochrome c peroxidase